MVIDPLRLQVYTHSAICSPLAQQFSAVTPRSLGWNSSDVGVAAVQETWMDVARPRIQQRIEAYSGAEIRFNLMAIGGGPQINQVASVRVRTCAVKNKLMSSTTL